jgi:hypothetical protein
MGNRPQDLIRNIEEEKEEDIQGHYMINTSTL